MNSLTAAKGEFNNFPAAFDKTNGNAIGTADKFACQYLSGCLSKAGLFGVREYRLWTA